MASSSSFFWPSSLAALVVGGGGPPPQNATYSVTELKYLLLDHDNESRFFFCDPDSYPISHGDELEKAIGIFPDIQNNTGEFTAIITRKGLQPPYPNESKLIIYRECKKLNAIQITPATTTSYEFSLDIQAGEGGMQVSGIIRTDGRILEEHSEPAFLTCPICLVKGTMIDIPDGPIPVEEVRPGMVVWTTDGSGLRIAASILVTGKTPVLPGHRLIHIMLSDGREIAASPGHPTADNQTLGMLRCGDQLDGGLVTATDTTPCP